MNIREWGNEIFFVKGLKQHAVKSNRLLLEWLSNYENKELIKRANSVLMDFVDPKVVHKIVELN